MKRFDRLYQSIKDVAIGRLIYNYYFRDIQAGWKMEKPHSHNAIEIICCIDGRFHAWAQKESNAVMVKKPECLILEQGIPHRIYLEKDANALCVCIQINKDAIIPGLGCGPFIEEEFNLLKDKCYGGKGFIKVLDDSTIADNITRIIREINEKEADWEETVKFEAVGLFIKLYKNIKKQYEGITNKSNEHIYGAMTYIYENILNPITPKDIARHIHISPNHLMHLFKQCTGKSVMDTVMGIRAERGKNLLENTTLSISEVAFQCGYPTLQHFSMHFKKLYGTSPSEYRKQIAEIDLLQSR